MDQSSFTKSMNTGYTILPNLLLQHFKTLGMSHDEVLLVIQLKSFLDKGILFPDIQKLASRLDLSQEEVFRLIHQLTHKKILQIKVQKDEEGKTQDIYSLDFLWEKLVRVEKQETENQESKLEKENQQNLFKLFEQQFSRPLSPIEIQTIGMWLEEDHYAVSLIEFALREAVLSQVYSLKYIDRILLTWEKKNIRTKEQAEKESILYRERNYRQESREDPGNDDEPIPLHNWLNGNR